MHVTVQVGYEVPGAERLGQSEVTGAPRLEKVAEEASAERGSNILE